MVALTGFCLISVAAQRHFKNSTFCPHSVSVFCVDMRTNCDYFPIQQQLVGLYNQDGVFTARYELDIYIILPPAHTVYLCVLCGSQNKQRLFPYTALTDWFV